MERFSVPNELKRLISQYPDAALLSSVAKNGGHQSRQAIAHQWLSEGIPFAFKECPGLYESIRIWLGTRLQIEPKSISLTGSAKIGQSLNPTQIGKPFSENSDLDLFVISNSLFEKLVSDFNSWTFDFESGVAIPSNERENIFWKDNLIRGPKNISKGFLDSNLTPNHDKYSHICNVSQTMWLLTEKMKITPDAPLIKKASIRCYKNWECYVNQMSISLM